jgi:hypothetical protein
MYTFGHTEIVKGHVSHTVLVIVSPVNPVIELISTSQDVGGVLKQVTEGQKIS